MKYTTSISRRVYIMKPAQLKWLYTLVVRAMIKRNIDVEGIEV